MAVDTLFGSVHVLIQGAGTANAALPAATPGFESLPWLVTPTVSGITAGADHSVFSSAGRISLAQSGYPNKTWGPVLDIELVIEQAWDAFGKLLENGTIKIEADTDTPNRYVLHWNAFYLYPNAPPHWEAKGGFFVPASGRFLLRVHGSAAANTVSVTIITQANASTTAVYSVGGLLGAYPLTIGTPGTASQINPPPSEASASASGDPVGQYADATPSRATFFATFNRSTTPASGSVTISGCGVSYVANATGKTASALSSELASSFVSALSSAGYTASYGFNGTSYEITIQPKSASDPHYPYHSFSVSGSAVFAAAGEGWAANATVPLSTGGSLQQVAVWGAPPGVVQTSRFTVFVADGAKEYLLSMTVAGVTATANLQNNVAGALATLAGQLGLGAWQQTTPGTYVNSRSYTNPGPVPDTASIVQNVVQPSAITKLYALRVTEAERTEATFPTLPWPTTSIPSSGGGGGTTLLPANVLFAMNAEAGFNDLSIYGATANVNGSGTITRVATGSRTGDAYLNNSSGEYGVDAGVHYTMPAGARALWESSTVMTLEFDIYLPPYTGTEYGNTYWLGFNGLTGAANITFTPTVAYFTDPLTAGSVNATLQYDQWHHVAYVADTAANEIAVYVNGVQQILQLLGGSGYFGPGWVNTGSYVADYTINLMQIYGRNDLASFKGGLDNVLLTAAKKYTSNFTPPTSFQAATGGIGGSGVTVVNFAGYNDLDGATGTGTFNTQATYPTAYFSANVTLEGASASGDTFVVDGNTITFSGSRTLAAATNTGTFVRGTPVTFEGDATAEDALSNAAFYAGLPLEWSGDSVLEDASQLGIYLFLAPAEFSGGAVLDGVTPGLTSFNLIDPVVWRVNAEVPAATLVANATQFLVNAQVPAATLRASMSEYRGFELAAQVPAVSLSAWSGLGVSGQVPMATLSASGTVVNTLRLDAELPRVTLAADALLGQLLSMSATVPAPTLSAWAGAGVAGIVPVATCAANVVSGGAFRVDATVPAATAAIGATSMNVLRLAGDVPTVARANWMAISRQVPAIGMLANIAPVSAVTRVAYSFTIANSAMTRYPAYPFIQVIRMGNIFYGVAEDGLHEIGGTTDNAVPIPWAWETCLSDFGQAERKTVVSAYLGGYVPEAMTYTIRAGDVPTGTNSHATTATAVLRNHRQKFGIGRKSRYFAFGLSAAQGRVSIESIEFEVATMSRRI